jgi:hypothetical protein
MGYLPNQVLEDAVREATAIEREVSALRRDLEFAEKGSIIEFAADFSEVYSFLFPSDTKSLSLLFESERKTEVVAFQADVLHQCFFGPFGPPLLLPSHLLEMEGKLGRLNRQGLSEALKVLDSVRLERDRALGTEEGKRLQELHQRLQSGGIPLDATELEFCTEFFAEHLPSLVAFSSSGGRSSIERLKQLRHEKGLRFLGPEERPNIEDDDPVLLRWYKALNRSRHGRDNKEDDDFHSANYLDAMAVATLCRMSQHPGRRVCLITRSQIMHQIMREEENRGLWVETGGGLVRHPRVFSSFFLRDLKRDQAQTLTIQPALQSIDSKLQSLRLFLASARTRLDSGVRAAPLEWYEVTGLISELKNEWRAAQALAGSVAYTSARLMGDVLQLLFEEDELLAAVDRHVEKEIAHLRRGYEFLGWVIQGGPQTGTRGDMEFGTAGAVTRLDSLWMPYWLQFYSIGLQERAKSLQLDMAVSWQQFAQFFRSLLSEPDEYETLLAMAFSLGALGHWQLAESYCRRALEAEGGPEVARHEGLFFLAICHRKHAPSIRRLKTALKLLERADSTRGEVGEHPVEDPRYLKEKAVIIYYLNDLAVGGAEREEIPDLASVEQILRRALDACAVTDEKLEIQIVNNLCYLYAEHGRPEDQEKTRHLLDRLVMYYSSRLSDRLLWPPSAIDTVAWVKVRLKGPRATLEEISDSIRWLEGVNYRSDLTPLENKQVKLHLEGLRTLAGELRRNEPSGLRGS